MIFIKEFRWYFDVFLQNPTQTWTQNPVFWKKIEPWTRTQTQNWIFENPKPKPEPEATNFGNPQTEPATIL